MSRDIENILDFVPPNSLLINYANKILTEPVFNKIKDRSKKLKIIASLNEERLFKRSDEHSLKNSYIKFKTIYFNKTDELLAKKELKDLAYGLNFSTPGQASIYEQLDELNLLLKMLDNQWKDSYILGLFDGLLKNWNLQNYNSFVSLNKFLLAKISRYTGNRKIIRIIQKNLKYFSASNGDILLGADLANLGKNIIEATDFLSLPKNWITYPYFSKVIDTYYEKKSYALKIVIKEMDEIFGSHKLSTTIKRTLSKIIILSNESGDEEIKNFVKSLAFKYIGDPEINMNWNFSNGNENEKQNIAKAHQIVNNWVTEQFISVFFEKCINDRRRKLFWLSYTPSISEFRVVGTREIKRMLKNDNRIKDLVDFRFITTTNTNSQNSAILLRLKNHILVEFSDSGAFYAYKSNNPKAPDLKSKSIYSIYNLKDTNMPTLFYRQGNYMHSMRSEGRQSHQDGYLSWEEALSKWISEKVF